MGEAKMNKLGLLVRIPTPFLVSGGIDETALRLIIRSLIAQKCHVIAGSSGTGEGYALSRDELKRIFKISVEECRGKVRFYANPPENHTAKATREMIEMSAATGADIFTLFPLAGWHGMRPTDLELLAYYDAVLSGITLPIALVVHPLVGYTPTPALLAKVINKYPQITEFFFTGVGDDYFVRLTEMVDRKIDFYTMFTASLQGLAMGSAGLIATEATIIPKTFRRYVDLYEQGKIDEMGRVYADIRRFLNYVSAWHPSNVRAIKMAMKVLKLPGGEGGLREPYRLPPDDEMASFTDGLLRLGVAEINDQARAAGLKVPA